MGFKITLGKSSAWAVLLCSLEVPVRMGRRWFTVCVLQGRQYLSVRGFGRGHWGLRRLMLARSGY